MMRGTIFPNKSGTIKTERYRKILQADIVDNLVVGTLGKGGIDGHKGAESL